MTSEKTDKSTGGEGDAWQDLAEDLFGIDLAAKRDETSDSDVSDTELDSFLIEDSSPEPECIAAPDEDSPESETLSAAEAPISESGDESEDAPPPVEDEGTPAAESEEEESDPYWDVLQTLSWDEDSSSGSKRGNAGVRERSRLSSKKEAVEEDGPSVTEKPATAPRRRSEAFVVDDDFGIGVLDGRDGSRSSASESGRTKSADDSQGHSSPGSQPTSPVVFSEPAVADQDPGTTEDSCADSPEVAELEKVTEGEISSVEEEDDTKEPTERRRRGRRRRRRTRSRDIEAADSDSAAQDEQQERDEEQQAEDDQTSAQKPEGESESESEGRKRSRRRPRRRRREAVDTESADVDDVDVAGLGPDEETEASEEADDDDRTVAAAAASSKYANVPSWEEAISCLLGNKRTGSSGATEKV